MCAHKIPERNASGLDGGREFEPVWISSLEHMQKFIQIDKNASWMQRLLGLYKFPERYPRLRLFGLPPGIPIIYFASGKLSVYPKCIRFDSKPQSLFGVSFLYVRRDFSLRIFVRSIISVEEFNVAKQFRGKLSGWGQYDFPWTRIQTSENGVPSDLLIGIGGLGPSITDQLRRRNKELFQTLQLVVP